jgi:hypothetical protein
MGTIEAFVAQALTCILLTREAQARMSEEGWVKSVPPNLNFPWNKLSGIKVYSTYANT